MLNPEAPDFLIEAAPLESLQRLHRNLQRSPSHEHDAVLDRERTVSEIQKYVRGNPQQPVWSSTIREALIRFIIDIQPALSTRQIDDIILRDSRAGDYEHVPVRDDCLWGFLLDWVPASLLLASGETLHDSVGDFGFWLMNLRPQCKSWTIYRRFLRGEFREMFAEAVPLLSEQRIAQLDQAFKRVLSFERAQYVDLKNMPKIEFAPLPLLPSRMSNVKWPDVFQFDPGDAFTLVVEYANGVSQELIVRHEPNHFSVIDRGRETIFPIPEDDYVALTIRLADENSLRIEEHKWWPDTNGLIMIEPGRIMTGDALGSKSLGRSPVAVRIGPVR